MTKKPQGRSLADFPSLSSVERQLLEASPSGAPVNLATERPNARTRVNEVRGEFIRFLALGGDDDNPVHEKGIEVRGAYIYGDLDLEGCRDIRPLWLLNCVFENNVVALDARLNGLSLQGSLIPGFHGDRLQCAGGLFLRQGFRSTGSIRLSGAAITGDLDFTDSELQTPEAKVLFADNMSVKGHLYWEQVEVISGIVDFNAAQVEWLNDDWQSWEGIGEVILDGFNYNRVGAGRITEKQRLKWLRKQNPGKYNVLFWPHPWEHLAKTYREMGHPEEAKIVLIEKQREMRRLGLIGNRTPSLEPGAWGLLDRSRLRLANALSKLLHIVYGGLAGYGYRPLRTVLGMACAWAIATAVYSWGEARGLFGPTAAAVLTNPRYTSCNDDGSRWTRCDKLPESYSTFDPPMYALDVLLPLVDLKQEGDWAPIVRRANDWSMWDGMFVRGVMWAEIIFGWITSLLLVSAVGRLVQKD